METLLVSSFLASTSIISTTITAEVTKSSLKLVSTFIGGFTLVGPGLGASTTMDYYDLYNTMVGVHAGYLGQGYTFLVYFKAYSFHATSAAKGLGLGATYTRLRYISSDRFGHAARKGTLFGLDYSTLDGRDYVRVKLLSFSSIGRGFVILFTRLLDTGYFRLFSFDTLLASGRAKLYAIGIGSCALDITLSFCFKGAYALREFGGMFAGVVVFGGHITRIYLLYVPTKIPIFGGTSSWANEVAFLSRSAFLLT